MGKLVGVVIEKHKIAWKIKMQISNFCRKFALGLSKPKRKFFRQMVYGIQRSKDIKLSSITRALGEDSLY
jgi:hypothetical protein